MIPVQIAPDLGSQWAFEGADGCALQGKSSPKLSSFVTSPPFTCLEVPADRSLYSGMHLAETPPGTSRKRNRAEEFISKH